jgi:hypothetical protein
MPALNLPDTTSSTNGVIMLGGVPFLHRFRHNTFIGGAGNFTTGGDSNNGIGFLALSSNTSGVFNEAIGFQAMAGNTTGSDNIAMGYQALGANTGGNLNVALGEQALAGNTTGNRNTAVGIGALGFVFAGNTTGSQNVALGYGAGVTAVGANENTTGSNNTFIGYNSGPGTPTQLNNATAIGANALVSQDNSIVLGDGRVDVGIGTSSPTQALDVVGSGKFSGSLTIGGSSANATPITAHLSGSGAVSYTVGGGSCSDSGSLSVPGAQSGDAVSIGIDPSLATSINFTFTGYVSAGGGSVTIRACNFGGAGGSASGTVKVDVWQH